MSNNIGKNIAYGLAGLGLLVGVYVAEEPITNYVAQHNVQHNKTVPASELQPYTIITRQRDSIERIRLNCAPDTTPGSYKNAVLKNNEKGSVALSQGDVLEVLVDKEAANDWCNERVIDQNRHLNE